MKKTLIIIPAVALSVFFATRAMAAEPVLFYEPIPIESSENQVRGGSPTKNEATHIKFFRHPVTQDTNFSTDSVEMPDGYTVKVSDVVATPGLLPEGQKIALDAFEDMLDYLGSRYDGTSLMVHGFCPEPILILDDFDNAVYMALDCQAFEGTQANRQLEIADIHAEVGSAHDGLSPYDPRKLYPATVRGDKVFRWEWLDAPDPGYEQVIAYGIADLEQGIVTAAYDPLTMVLANEVSLAFRGGSYEFGFTLGDPTAGMPWRYYSPLIFFRKDAVQTKRLRLAGYSTLQLPDEVSAKAGVDLSNLGLIGSLSDLWNILDLEKLLTFDNLLKVFTLNFNPIDVVAMEYSEPVDPTKMMPKHGFAVTNQATIANLDQGLILYGVPIIDINAGNPGGAWFPLMDYLGYMDGGSFHALDASRMPHRLFSYVIFWGPAIYDENKFRTWGGPDLEDKNPNAAFSPFAYAMVGPGMFHTVATADGSLVVPSGAPAEDGKYYIYKIDPVNGQHAHLRFPLNGSRIDKELPIIVPEFTPMTLPEKGVAPYGVDAANIDGDDCDDIVVTFSGQQTVALDPDFKNDYDQKVVFQVSKDDPRMFSNAFKVYFGKKVNGKCVFIDDGEQDGPNSKTIRLRPIGSQIAAAVFSDFTNDGKPDLLVGDLMPRTMADGRCTGYAFLYRWDGRELADLAPTEIRVGFGATDFCPAIRDDQRDPSYLRQVAKEGKGLFGVAALDADYQPGQGSNIAAINGWPLVLPGFGCYGDTEEDKCKVASVIELLYSRLNNKAMENFFEDKPLLEKDRYLVPRSCVNPQLCSPDPQVVIGGDVIQLPFFAEQKCCNPCDPDGVAGTGDEWTAQGNPNNKCWQSLTLNALLPVVDVYIHPRHDEIINYYNTYCALGEKCSIRIESDAGEVFDLTSLDATNACCIEPDLTTGEFQEDELMECCAHVTANPAYCNPTSEEYDTSYKYFCAICNVYDMDASNDDKADGKERTEFASTYRPDRVYTTQGHWIADRANLIPAQAVGQLEVGELVDQLDRQLPGMAGGVFEPKEPREPLMTPLLPRGHSGAGEKTVVLRRNLCDRDGVQDEGEECDRAGHEKPDCVIDGLDGVCTANCECIPLLLCTPNDECDSHDDCGEGSFCGVDCECHESPDPRDCGNGVLDPGEECDLGHACKEPSQQCLINCTCTDVGPDLPETLVQVQTDCECRVQSFSSEFAAKAVKDMMGPLQQATGRMTDERIVEPGQEIMCVCCVQGGATQAKAMGAGQNIRPWMVVQESGTVPQDISKMELIQVKPLLAPTRIFPIELSEAMGKAMVLPDLSASTDPDILALSTVPPLAASSVHELSSGAVVLNNMYQHQVVAITPSQMAARFSGGLSGLETKDLGVVEEGEGVACHLVHHIVSYDYPPILTLAPYPDVELPPGKTIDDLLYENRMLDLNAVRDYVASTGNFDRLQPWEFNLNYSFTVVQETGEGPKVVKYAFLGAPPMAVAEGAGCKGCYVTSAPATLGSVLPMIAVVVFATGGIVIGRIRRRRR